VAQLKEMQENYRLSRERWAALQGLDLTDAIFDSMAQHRLQVMVGVEAAYFNARRPELQREQEFKIAHSAYSLSYWKSVLQNLPEDK
jgi:hypothetical protein